MTEFRPAKSARWNWINGLNAGTFTIAQAAATIAGGALSIDLRTFQAKTAAAIYFTNALDNPTKVLYYQAERAIAWGKAYLSVVSEDNPYPPVAIPPNATPYGSDIGVIGIPEPGPGM